MKAEAIKTKKLSVKQYLYKIMPYLSDLINDIRLLKIILMNGKFKQIFMSILFLLMIMEKIVLFLCGVIMKKLVG